MLLEKGLLMKVFLKQDIENLGMAGEIVRVTNGFANNFLLPRKFAIQVDAGNEAEFRKKMQHVESRKDVIASKTSMLAERIRSLTLTLKRKVQEEGRLYGSVSQNQIADALKEKGVSVSKSQVVFNKAIKEIGKFPVTIRLSSSLQPVIDVKVVAE
jgi:large subunit ribosomal protein L9